MVIKSMLDTDLYKFTTSYAYMKLFPQAEGTFSFTDRDATIYDEEFIQNLRIEFYNLAQLQLTNDEFDFMNECCRFIPRVYWEWLRSFRFEANKINAYLDGDNRLHITVTDNLYKATLYEVPLLAMVSELRNKWLGNRVGHNSAQRLTDKISLSNIEQLKFSEFGTRRRYNFNVQEQVISRLKDSSIYCVGTSNCYFAMEYDMKMIGTHPHEWFMFHGAQYGYKQANYMALENWVNVYDGDLGIALSDTYTTDAFMKNFSCKHAKLFDGVRHDSGDPYKFILKVISRYHQFGIDPTSKTIVFSNALTFPDAVEIKNYCEGRIKCSFGIGTNLTNDTGNKPSNIVMKLTSCRMNKNQPTFNCIKLSDDMGKHTGNEDEIKHCLIDLNLK